MIGKKSKTIYGLITLPDRNPNLIATLYYAGHEHIAETRNSDPNSLFLQRTGIRIHIRIQVRQYVRNKIPKKEKKRNEARAVHSPDRGSS